MGESVRPKLTVGQQVAHMRASGIRFELCGEAEAGRFLAERNFFFKLKAYDNSFDKFTDPGHPDFGKYVDLDFAYLVELSRLDRALRYAVMPAALDVEHFLKVRLNEAVSRDDGVDGYDVVGGYLAQVAARKVSRLAADVPAGEMAEAADRISRDLGRASGLARGGDPTGAVVVLDAAKDEIEALMEGLNLRNSEKSIARLADSSYSRRLACKYGLPGRTPLWAFLELASFGDIIGVYKHYFIDMRGGSDPVAKRVKPLLFPAKALRNAAAHNSCVLHDLRGRMGKPVGRIAQAMRRELGIDPALVASTRRVPVVHDLGALLLTYDAVVPDCDSKAAHARRMRELSGAFAANLGWFAKQPEVHGCLAMMAAMFEAFGERGR